jgi:hypothetical protein
LHYVNDFSLKKAEKETEACFRDLSMDLEQCKVNETTKHLLL